MAKTRQDARINTRSARVSLKQRREPYWRNISKGLAIGYRKGANGGTWIARHFSTATGRRIESLGIADDFADADGIRILSFDQAQTAGRAWFQRKTEEDTGEVISNRFTVAMALDEYIEFSETNKGKTLNKTRATIEGQIKPALGDIQVRHLNYKKLRGWRDGLLKTAPRLRTTPGRPQAYREVDMTDSIVLKSRKATVNKIVGVLKSALNHAKSESRRISSDAAWKDIKPYANVNQPKIRFLTMDEVSALIPTCESSFQSLVKSALLTGCRYGELAAMTVDAFDADQGTVFVAQSKNGESRHVELNDEAIAFFSEVTEGRRGNETMFLRSNGKVWKASEQQRPMDDGCEAAKIEGVTFHILRHTYASHAAMNGMPISVLAGNLGHKDTRITEKHYAHLSKGHRQKLIRENAPSFGFASKLGPVLVSKAS